MIMKHLLTIVAAALAIHGAYAQDKIRDRGACDAHHVIGRRSPHCWFSWTHEAPGKSAVVYWLF